MLTIVRCTRVAVWTLVMGLPALVSGEEGLPSKARDTVPTPREQLSILVVNVDGSPRSRGMECCVTRSLAYSQVTEVGRSLFAVSALPAMQGTNTLAHDVYQVLRQHHSPH